jgi:hypothetical protein
MRGIATAFLGAVMTTAGLAVAQSPAKPLQVQETNTEGITAEVTDVTRKEGVVTVKVRYRNTGQKTVRMRLSRNWGDIDNHYLVAGTSKMLPLRDAQKTAVMSPLSNSGDLDPEIKPAGSYVFWVKFPAPPASTKKVTFFTPSAPPFEDLPITEAQ